ncbi:MAG: cobalt transporter CbiM [Planctomycetes bacterium]|nr:cobalt transporter CbiM [Planctomycetota bacterium]
MHIHEVVLAGSPQGILVLSVGAAGAVAGTALGLRRIDYERVPRVAMLSAAFFVVSVVQVQLGPASVHLVLNGLVGLILGWAAFPALLIALLLQAVLFSEGGLFSLGLNTLNMALPAVVCHYLFRRPVQWRNGALAFSAGMAAGGLGVLLAALLTAAALWISGETFRFFAGAVLAVNAALAVVEGLVTASVAMFLRKVRPELLDAPLVMPSPES